MAELFDYIIVGAGSAGCVVASRLSEDTRSTVLLIEAGPEDTNPDIHIPRLCTELQDDANIIWSYMSEPQEHACFALKERRSIWPRGRVIGGSGCLNSLVYARGCRQDFDSWEKLGASGWGYNDVLPYFKKSENNTNARYAATSSHHQGGPMTVSDTAPVTKLPTVVMDAVRELGYKEKDINDGEMLGFMRAQTTVSQDGRRHHTANAFLHPAENRKNLTIRANSVACKILFDGLRAVGVKYRSRFTDTEVYANKEIILCAGTIASSQLLMLSGVGPRNHLENLGISVIADLPVGKNLQDHLILVPMRISGPETLPPEWLSSVGVEAVGFIKTGTDPDPKWPDIQLHCQIGYYHRGPNENRFLNFSEMFAKPLQHDISFEERAKKSGLALMVMICRPKSVGEIRLRTTNPFDHPIIDPQYLSHPSDVRTMIEGCRFSKKMTETKAFKKYGAEAEYYNFPNCSHPFDSDGYWEYVVRHASTSVYHTVGTCKMGAVNDPTAVVDSSLRVRGLQGIRVMDSSIMPYVTSGNINAPVVMIAEKGADLIKHHNTRPAL